MLQGRRLSALEAEEKLQRVRGLPTTQPPTLALEIPQA
jgi:hypothetical protein